MVFSGKKNCKFELVWNFSRLKYSNKIINLYRSICDRYYDVCYKRNAKSNIHPNFLVLCIKKWVIVSAINVSKNVCIYLHIYLRLCYQLLRILMDNFIFITSGKNTQIYSPSTSKPTATIKISCFLSFY